MVREDSCTKDRIDLLLWMASRTPLKSRRLLYEAVAKGLAAIRGHEWVAGIVQGLNVVKVSVADVRVEYEVKLMDFTKWLEGRAVPYER